MGCRVPVLVALLAACGRDAPDAEEAGRYARPAIRELVARAKAKGPVATPALAFEAIGREREGPASKAVWSAVEKAEARGLLELYGAEWFGLETPSYRALVFVRTSSGTHCLHADSGLHGAREDPTTVPAQPIPEAGLASLRDRIRVQLPLPVASSLESGVGDGELVLLHVMRDGRSQAALWYAPARGWEPLRAPLSAASASYPVTAIVDALWAGTPITLFPRAGEDPELAYAKLPGYGG